MTSSLDPALYDLRMVGPQLPFSLPLNAARAARFPDIRRVSDARP